MAKIHGSCEQLLTAYLVRGSIPLFHKILNTKAAISATNKMVPPAIPSVVSLPKMVQDTDVNYYMLDKILRDIWVRNGLNILGQIGAA